MFATSLLMIGIRTTGRAQEKDKPVTTKGVPTRLMGEVSVAPVRMGDIVVPQRAATNGIGALTNCPGTNHGPIIMGSGRSNSDGVNTEPVSPQ